MIDHSQCPCGRARAGCEYHDPTLQPAQVQHPYRFRFAKDATLRQHAAIDVRAAARHEFEMRRLYARQHRVYAEEFAHTDPARAAKHRIAAELYEAALSRSGGPL